MSRLRCVAVLLVIVLTNPVSAQIQDQSTYRQPLPDRTLVAPTLPSETHVKPSFFAIDPHAELKKQQFWDNRDWDWYQQNIPFFDCPDADITTTYYYRWEAMTKHLVYGSPKDGYAFTEFIDRPFWSGTYGAISCPAGHQLYESRWLRSPRIGYDYARYWFRTEGAEPRNYSCWLADSVWALHSVHPDELAVVDLLPDLVKNFEGWEARHWVEEQGMFWQTGHDDGMEFNINSRQTADILRGAPGFRPTINTYMWADARAIARAAALAHDDDLVKRFSTKADALKERLQKSLWDPKREFFLQRYLRDEERDGFKIKAGSLTYETGQHAGSPHGREEIGYVPWQFGLPDPGYEAAWKFLMDENYFAAPFGPRTVERNDPMYYLSQGCCWWSGQSWPYATTQTLKAMANLLHDYKQEFVTRDDYIRLLTTFAKTHRKNGQPYIAEGCHPETGSWEGHDAYNHSEHYFHSGYVDLVLTGVVGIRAGDENRLEIDPLAPATWDYFCVDNLVYRGHQVSILWDRTGKKYNKGEGFQIVVDGQVIAKKPAPTRVDIDLPDTQSDVERTTRRVNVAVNNSLAMYPQMTGSTTAKNTAPSKAIDGNYWYHISPPNRWASTESDSGQHWIEVNFGVPRVIDEVRLYWLDDLGANTISAPREVNLQYWEDDKWQSIKHNNTGIPEGHRANRFPFAAISTAKVRIEAKSAPGRSVGLTEIECWGPADQDLSPPPAPEGNLAARRKGQEFPKAQASFTSRYDKVDEAVDGLIGFQAEPRNRWTCYESPNREDWFEVDFGKETIIGKVELGFYDDGGGVQTPEKYRLEFWDGKEWKPIQEITRTPENPTSGQMNLVSVSPTKTTKVRVVLVHRGNSKSGLTEIQIWAPTQN
jgi:F5/8 type C domain